MSVPVTIDERISSHIPPLRQEELAQLEELIARDGCRHPLVVWNGILLDGHNRYAICNRLGLPYSVEDKTFADIDAALAWVEDNQLGRRNLTADQFAYFIGRKYERLKRSGGRPPGKPDQIDQVNFAWGAAESRGDHAVGETAYRVAGEHGISAPTVRRAADYARNVDTVADALGESVRPQILSGRVGDERLTRQDVAEIAEIAPRAVERGLSFSSPKDALDWAAKERSQRAAAKRAENDALKAQTLVSVPDARYGTIVIDPPWDMQKIERDVRPNQVSFDYPTMTEDELAEFRLSDMAADDCHLFCWTTHKFLPSALRLIEKWGFRYVLTMVWHKPGGFQPIGLPQYNCEFVVYARRGTPEFVDTKAFPCCFQAPRREHSRKPDEFYDIVRRVTGDRRIDVFSRESRDGFAQFGNETDKFVAA